MVSSDSYTAFTYGETKNTEQLDNAKDRVPSLSEHDIFVVPGFGKADFEFQFGVGGDLIYCILTQSSVDPQLTNTQIMLGLDSNNVEVPAQNQASTAFSGSADSSIYFNEAGQSTAVLNFTSLSISTDFYLSCTV